MTAKVLDGKQLGEALRARVGEQARAFAQRAGRPAGLAVVLVGEDPASAVYVRNKARACETGGMHSEVHRLAADSTQAALLELVQTLNARDEIDGILVQLPLPKGIDENAVLEAVDPRKDVDGFHPENGGRLLAGRPSLVPCTPLGCMRMLEHTGVELAGKHAVVLGRSNIVGKPVALLLLQRHATVTIAHSRTLELPALCRTADVLVAAVGRAQLVKGDWVKEGAIVLDVGINRTAEGKLVGDVDYAAASERAGWLTPVPGGVGPMTIACLLENTVRAATLRAGFEQ